MTDAWRRPDVGRKAPLTPEQEKVHSLQIARGTLTGMLVFDCMEEAKQASLIADTVEIVAYIKRKHRGHYRSDSPDVSWDALNHAYLKIPAQASAFGRFRQAFGASSHEVYRTLYSMLQERVTTREALDAKSKPPPDLLEGMTGLKAAEGDAFKWGE
jgi:hypothetical protein